LRADTLGSLEALVVLLEKEGGLKAKRASVGNVTRKDVMEAQAIKTENSETGVIFAYNVKMDEIAVAEAQRASVRIFSGNVIYKLIEDYQAFVREEREAKKREKLERLVRPVSIRCLPQFIFRHSKPAVVGVRITAGELHSGIQLMNEKGETVGRVVGIQNMNKAVEVAHRGEEIAVSIEGAVIGRNLEGHEDLYSVLPKGQAVRLENAVDLLNDDEVELIEKIKSISITEEEKK
jgi:translation initiation factor 5B